MNPYVAYIIAAVSAGSAPYLAYWMKNLFGAVVLGERSVNNLFKFNFNEYEYAMYGGTVLGVLLVAAPFAAIFYLYFEENRPRPRLLSYIIAGFLSAHISVMLIALASPLWNDGQGGLIAIYGDVANLSHILFMHGWLSLMGVVGGLVHGALRRSRAER